MTDVHEGDSAGDETLSDDDRPSTLGRRGSRVLTIIVVVVILVLAYLSARVLIEGARNPMPTPEPLEAAPPPPGR